MKEEFALLLGHTNMRYQDAVAARSRNVLPRATFLAWSVRRTSPESYFIKLRLDDRANNRRDIEYEVGGLLGDVHRLDEYRTLTMIAFEDSLLLIEIEYNQL